MLKKITTGHCQMFNLIVSTIHEAYTLIPFRCLEILNQVLKDQTPDNIWTVDITHRHKDAMSHYKSN